MTQSLGKRGTTVGSTMSSASFQTFQNVSFQTRPKTLLEKQPYLAAYGFFISVFSPSLTAYQLCKLYKKTMPPSQLFRLSMHILPHQTILKASQMNAATPVKEYLNPWAAFAVVGVLQGGVYGQCNVHFARVLSLSNNVSMRGIFRGAVFAGGRDSISQGLPFVCSKYTEQYVFTPLFRSLGLDSCPCDSPEAKRVYAVKRALSVMSTSIFASVASQGLHNAQIKMQADHSLTYIGTMSKLWGDHGASVFWKGVSARMWLLLVVNGLNEILLKPAWEEVPC